MFYLNDLGLLCTLGTNKAAVSAALLAEGVAPPDPRQLFTPCGTRQVGQIGLPLQDLPAPLVQFNCRNNRLAAAAIEQFRPAIAGLIERHGASRIGVVMGTSTTGIAESERAVKTLRKEGHYPRDYHPVRALLGGLGEFVAAYLQLSGPVYTVSTACSSSANALLSARRLLSLDLCDAVVVGGVDSLCDLTLQGFGSLEALSEGFSAPFTHDRDGINIGEAAAIFLMTREPSTIGLAGGAGSSDAYHISAPHPEGEGAYRAMRAALGDAGLTPGDIDYLNLHGTGTRHNDGMESQAVNALFGSTTPCSSTKSLTGHTLGAAGALELGLCWLLLDRVGGWRLPPTLYRDRLDKTLAPLNFTGNNCRGSGGRRYCMSNSFAFGGSNVALVVSRTDD